MQKPERNDTEILQHKRVTQADGNVTEKFDTSLIGTLLEWKSLQPKFSGHY